MTISNLRCAKPRGTSALLFAGEQSMSGTHRPLHLVAAVPRAAPWDSAGEDCRRRTAATLHAAGVTDIQSSTQAAEALRPVAGPLAFILFALGIIGTGLLAVPVLAGSAAYAVGEA